MKKAVFILLAAQLCMLCACGGESGQDGVSGEITVVSREDGSGTREAFATLAGIVDGDGYDLIYDGAEITNSNAVMLSSVEGNKRAVGYASLGALEKIAGAKSRGIKAISVSGTAPTTENVKSGAYKIARRFALCFKKDSLSPAAQDFLSYVLSAQGQAIIEEAGFVAIRSDTSYTPKNTSGRVTVCGSTSVAPVIELISESYRELNPDVTLEIQQTGSSAGIASAAEGVCDFAMSSRALKESEKKRLVFEEIAADAIAVIVNTENDINDISPQSVRAVFTGEIRQWEELRRQRE